jgi:glutaredoxin
MHVELFTKDSCSYCTRAKQHLTALRIPFSENRLGIEVSREMIVEQFPTARTFPIVVVDGFYIGGFTELVSHLKEETSETRIVLNEGNS